MEWKIKKRPGGGMPKTPEQIAEEILMRGGVELHRSLPHSIKAAGSEFTGRMEIRIAVSMNTGGVDRIATGISYTTGGVG